MTRDQFLCEQMGKCWHTFSQSRSNYAGWVCSKCGERSKMLPHVRPADGINFSTSPADILALQQWVMGQEWWDEFDEWAYFEGEGKYDMQTGQSYSSQFTRWLFSDPDRFATLVAQYRGWKP